MTKSQKRVRRDPDPSRSRAGGNRQKMLIRGPDQSRNHLVEARRESFPRRAHLRRANGKSGLGHHRRLRVVRAQVVVAARTLRGRGRRGEERAPSRMGGENRRRLLRKGRLIGPTEFSTGN